MRDEVIVEDVGYARWITLDRPDCRNGLTPEVAEKITAAIREAADARAIGIAGLNGAFCSGLDLRVAMHPDADLMAHADEHLVKFQSVIFAIVDAPQPVVAVIDGAAAGFGCDMALACDLRIASDRAYFQESFVRIGLIPDGGGTWMLPRLVGLSKALEMAMLAEKLDAETALSLGLIWKIVPADQLETHGRELVERLAGGPPMALQRIKRLMREAASRDFVTAMTAEGKAQLECLRSEDCIEGVQAFFQKRPGAFTGR